MSNDLKPWDADRDQIRRWLEELRRAGEDFDLFIDGQFDELEQLWTRLENQQRDVTGHGDELSSHVAALHQSQRLLDAAAAEAQRCVDQLRAAAEAAAHQHQIDLGEQLAEIRAERRQMREELAASTSQVQELAETATAELANVHASLTDARQSLQTQGTNLAEMAEPLQAALAAHRQLLAQQEEQSQLRQAMANSPVERPEPVADDRVAAETSIAAAGRNTQVAGRRVRGRVDQGTAGVTTTAVADATDRSSPSTKRTATDPLDPVLDSVIAQFELLQNNLAGRNSPPRAAKS